MALYNLEELMQFFDIDPFDEIQENELINQGLEADQEIYIFLAPYVTTPIADPAPAELKSASNYRVKAKRIEKQDHERAAYFMGISDKLVQAYIEAKKRQNATIAEPALMYVTSGNVNNQV